MRKLLIVIVLGCCGILNIKAQNPKIEYLAHAAFILESSEGTRVLIDPYQSYFALGYEFPTKIDVDFVLITHPHFDHDASKHFSQNVPVFREAGEYSFNDVTFTGIASKHGGAEEMSKRGFQAYNTIWVVEMDGIKVGHLGDNEVVSDDEVAALGNMDYIIGQPTDAHFEKFKGDATYIPNHYLLPQITDYKNWMQPVDEWLTGKESINNVSGNSTELTKSMTSSILHLQPSATVSAWPEDYVKALVETGKASALLRTGKTDVAEEAMSHLNKVIELAPYTLNGYLQKANLLARQEKHQEAVELMEKALARTPNADWSREVSARKLLAQGYDKLGRFQLALQQYRWLARHDRITNLNDIKAAQDYITKFGNK